MRHRPSQGCRIRPCLLLLRPILGPLRFSGFEPLVRHDLAALGRRDPVMVDLSPPLDELPREVLGRYPGADGQLIVRPMREDGNAPRPVRPPSMGHVTVDRPFPVGEMGGTLDGWRLPVDGHRRRVAPLFLGEPTAFDTG